ncbi:MAG: TonB-dependent receptor [Sphingobacteriales bacterium]|nr:MAG: TonB-dependent receptor [Sphingobacteriales bacterium]
MRLFSRIILFILVIYLQPANLFGQKSDAYIIGTVTDTSGAPLNEVRIKFKDSRGGGVTTNSEGNYAITVKEGKSYTLEFSFINLPKKTFTTAVLQAGQQYKLDVILNTNYQVGTVTVTTKARDEKRTMERIIPKQFEAIPNVGGGFETILKTLAGVSSSNELSSQYSVRGGNFDENLVYIDDIEIYRPQLVRNGQQEGLSIIHTDLVKSVQFSAGGFEARYGDKLSSVLDIQYKEPDSFAAKAAVSLLGESISVEGSSADKRFTYLFGGRHRSSKYLLNSLDVQSDYQTNFADVQSYFTYHVSPTFKLGMLTYYGSNSYLSIPVSAQTTFGTVSTVIRLNVDFDGREILRQQTFLNGITASFTPNKHDHYKFISSVYSLDERENFDIIAQYKLQQLNSDPGSEDFGDVNYTFGVGGFLNHARNKLNTILYNAELKGDHTYTRYFDLDWGLKFQHENVQDKLSEYQYIDSVDYSVPQNNDSILDVYEYIYSRNNQQWNRYMGYVQNTFSLNNSKNMFLTVGVRGNYWDYNKEFLLSPRAQFTFEPNAGYNKKVILEDLGDSLMRKSLRFRASVGAYHQPPFYRELRGLNGQLNPQIRAQKSYHFVLGNDYTFKIWKRPFKLTSEVYYKQLEDIIPYEIDNVRIRYFAENNATGYAAGMDFQLNGEFVKDNPSWISVGLLKTEEDIKGDKGVAVDTATGELYEFTPGYIPRPTDQRFRVSVFFQDFLANNPNYKVHLMLVYASSLPLGPPDHERYKDVIRPANGYRRVDIGFSRQIYDKEKARRTDGWRKPFESIWLSAEVFNMFGIRNTVSYLWVDDIEGNNWAIPRYLTSRRLNVQLQVKF